MKQVVIQRGAVTVAEVPAPAVEPGAVLVRVAYSTISTGTEMSGIQSEGSPLWQRALKRPDKVAKVLATAATQGVGSARHMVESRVGALQAMGYSAAGRVLAVGAGIDDVRPGDAVACAGAGLANHAEIVRVPRNLLVPIPEGLALAPASTVTLGAIALQGVRRAEPTLGETFVVIGLGIIGQLTAQLLRANGVRVVATDLDPKRVDLATRLGADVGLAPEDADVEAVARLTQGIGADGVIITAATPSDAVVSTAFRMCRKKGRVVLVGDVGLNLQRADIYQKELDFLVSTSYGPGRYDQAYEERGVDYPVGYVRWTENRNMAEYLRLVAEGRVILEPLVATTYDVDRAPEAYAALAGADRPIAALLEYPERSEAAVSRVLNPRSAPAKTGAIRVAVVGAGSFAKGMHLPNLAGLPGDFAIRAIVSRTGANAVGTANQYGAAYSTTDYQQVLEDADVDLVIVATRHDRHGAMALDALRAGKHVLVEKPLTLSSDELDHVRAFFTDAEATARATPILQTGFNRRFSPHAARLAELTRGRTAPMLMAYRMNAGYLPADHWTQGPEGGGRNIGEACHIYDLFTFLTGARLAAVQAQAIKVDAPPYSPRDNFVATIRFEDGSVGSLTYTALGSPEHPKERLEVFSDGRVLALDDYRSLTVSGSKEAGLATPQQQKGQREELVALARAIRDGGDWPIPLWQQLQAMEIAFAVEPTLTGQA